MNFERLTRALEASAESAVDLLSRLSRLAQQVGEIVEQMDFSFLFDPERKFFPLATTCRRCRQTIPTTICWHLKPESQVSSRLLRVMSRRSIGSGWADN